ncbi:hypothetical protein BPOR_0428g00060 [Botrytis porri]|uniref:Uncharacterized protein n=1 Tax=Botrytis porri TaxID=87229 RepID=A0A4Z1KHV7_9HELO|nr:hypothetical protein BPOR_0428g00060 [Botrytis porri]
MLKWDIGLNKSDFLNHLKRYDCSFVATLVTSSTLSINMRFSSDSVAAVYELPRNATPTEASMPRAGPTKETIWFTMLVTADRFSVTVIAKLDARKEKKRAQ